MITLRNILVASILLFSSALMASIICPADMELHCSDDIYDIDLCGYPTLLGNHVNYQAKFVDDNQTTNCNDGTIKRKWFVDLNGDGAAQGNEPSCIQNLFLTYTTVPINPSFPQDLEVGCMDDVSVQSPTWVSGPCDQVAYNVDVEEFDFADGACRKILQHYTVINWCHYAPSDPNWDGSGIWTQTRVIKVIDNDAPLITECEGLTFGVEDNCETEVSFSMTATDGGDCPGGVLSWTASIDLWGDGTEDYFFGPNEPSPFRTSTTTSGGVQEITLPELVGIGNHKINWKVSDGCSNHETCITRFYTKDLKPPTPYCLNFLSTTFNGNHGPTPVHIDLFDRGSFDNCTESKYLRHSFSSNVNDTIQMLECGDQGVKFYNIYTTDEAGNQDFCEVFMLVLDNGTCNGSFAPQGRLESIDGSLQAGPSLMMKMNEDVVAEALPDESMNYTFETMQLMEDYYVEPTPAEGDAELVDLADLVLAQKHMLGISPLDGLSAIACDVNGDGLLKVNDLNMLKSHILGKNEWTIDQRYVPMYMVESGETHMTNQITYTNYHTGFDYYSFTRGNISDLIDAEVDETITFEGSWDGEVLTLSNVNEIFLDGQYLEIPSELGTLATDQGGLALYTQSKSYEVGQLEYVIEANAGKKQELISYLQETLQLVRSGTSNVAALSFDIIKEATSLELVDKEHIYPNPSNGSFYIPGNVSDITIMDISGRRLPADIKKDQNGATVQQSGYKGLALVRYFDGTNYKMDKIVIE